MTKKVCKGCGIEKSVSEFYKDKKYKDGYKPKCKECQKRHIGTCEVCRREFRSEKKNQKFCSANCQGKYNQKRINLKCDYCGKEYEIAECYFKDRNNHYCSKECKNKGHSNILTGKLRTSTIDCCSNCGQDVVRTRVNTNKEIFCSTRCYAEWRSNNWIGENHPSWEGGVVEVKCDYCGKIVFKKKSQVNNNNYCSVECMGKDRKRLYSGENNSNWQGGVTDISEYLRHALKKWREDSFKKYNYKCDISNSNKNLIIHHLYNFSDIVNEVFKITNIEINNKISDYSENELETLKEKCLKLHYKYGLGVCLTEELHKEFHNIYGKRNNTLEQYMEFKKNKIKEIYITETA